MRYRGRRAAAVLVFAGALLLPACGGGGGRSSTGSTALPTPTPTPPVPTSSTPSAIDGISGAAVAAAFSPTAPALSATVQAEASGYLLREQPFDGRPIALWPGSLAYVDELVYDWELADGSFRMVRWERPFVVTLSAELANDPQVVAKLQEVIAEIGRVTGVALTIGPNGPVTVRIDPSVSDMDAVASADLTFIGANVTRADVRFATRQEITAIGRTDYRNTLLHEMGHVMGLGHSPSTRDVMTPGAGPGTRVSEFQTDEAACLTMMYFHRRAGNTLPDRDAGLGTRAAGERHVRILD